MEPNRTGKGWRGGGKLATFMCVCAIGTYFVLSANSKQLRRHSSSFLLHACLICCFLKLLHEQNLFPPFLIGFPPSRSFQTSIGVAAVFVYKERNSETFLAVKFKESQRKFLETFLATVELLEVCPHNLRVSEFLLSFIIKAAEEFTKATVVTTIHSTTVPLSEVFFPAVTICNINQVQYTNNRTGCVNKIHKTLKLQLLGGHDTISETLQNVFNYLGPP